MLQRNNSRLNMDCSGAGGAPGIVSAKGENREPEDRRDAGAKDGRKRAKLVERETVPPTDLEDGLS